jgi:hypothetical protein
VVSWVASVENGRLLASPVWPGEQVTQGHAQPVGDEALREVVWAVVQHVTALAQAFQVAQVIMRRVMVEVSGGEDDAGGALGGQLSRRGACTAPAVSVPPVPGRSIEPTPIG